MRDLWSSDDGRTVLEGVVALTIVALTALGWSQMSTASSRADTEAARREVAAEIASGELETLRVTKQIELGASDAGGLAQLDGLNIVTHGGGPAQASSRVVDGASYGIQRYVLDPGTSTWRRIVVIVSWQVSGQNRDLRLDTAIPVLPAPAAVT